MVSAFDHFGNAFTALNIKDFTFALSYSRFEWAHND